MRGEFTADDLMAIAMWMRDPEGVAVAVPQTSASRGDGRPVEAHSMTDPAFDRTPCHPALDEAGHALRERIRDVIGSGRGDFEVDYDRWGNVTLVVRIVLDHDEWRME